jgi:hypothetical protein
MGWIEGPIRTTNSLEGVGKWKNYYLYLAIIGCEKNEYLTTNKKPWFPENTWNLISNMNIHSDDFH